MSELEWETEATIAARAAEDVSRISVNTDEDMADSLAEITKGTLVSSLMDLVEELEKAQQAVVTLSIQARQYQVELADRGTHMQFDALDGIITIAREITPAPGVTESIPEEFDSVEQITIVEPLDNRTVSQIQRESVPTAVEAAADSQSLEQFAGKEYQKALNVMMGIQY